MAFGGKSGGRPLGAVNKNRAAFVALLTKKPKKGPNTLERLIKKQVELAEGIWVQKEIAMPKGGVSVRVYLKEPDQKAGQFLIEQVIGKATQAVEVSDPSGLFAAGDKYLEE